MFLRDRRTRGGKEHALTANDDFLKTYPKNATAARPEIAGQQSVSLNTVNTHVRWVYTN